MDGLVASFEQNLGLARIIAEQGARLRKFIRRRVPDPADAEDIAQEVFYELIEANRMLMPIEHLTGWLYRVARNRITDLFRKEKPDALGIEDILPSADAGPDALYLRRVLLDELAAALAELPEEQRQVFVAHEIEGRSFKELARESGVNINTLLSRKRAAVLHLRERLRSVYDELE